MTISDMTARQAGTLRRLLEQIEIDSERIHWLVSQTNPDENYCTIDDTDADETSTLALFIKLIDHPTLALFHALKFWISAKGSGGCL